MIARLKSAQARVEDARKAYEEKAKVFEGYMDGIVANRMIAGDFRMDDSEGAIRISGELKREKQVLEDVLVEAEKEVSSLQEELRRMRQDSDGEMQEHLFV